MSESKDSPQPAEDETTAETVSEQSAEECKDVPKGRILSDLLNCKSNQP